MDSVLVAMVLLPISLLTVPRFMSLETLTDAVEFTVLVELLTGIRDKALQFGLLWEPVSLALLTVLRFLVEILTESLLSTNSEETSTSEESFPVLLETFALLLVSTGGTVTGGPLCTEDVRAFAMSPSMNLLSRPQIVLFSILLLELSKPFSLLEFCPEPSTVSHKIQQEPSLLVTMVALSVNLVLFLQTLVASSRDAFLVTTPLSWDLDSLNLAVATLTSKVGTRGETTGSTSNILVSTPLQTLSLLLPSSLFLLFFRSFLSFSLFSFETFSEK